MMTPSTAERTVDQTRVRTTEITRRVGGVPLLVTIFIVALFIPLFVFLGPVRLSTYRIVLLALFFPAIFRLLNGLAGRMRLPDFCVIGICVWSSISLMVIHSAGEVVEPIGIFWIEALGSYLVGRVYIRTPEAFYSVIRLLFWLCMLMLPFAIFEALASRNMILFFFDKIGSTLPDLAGRIDNRLGLNRVQGPFDHPILFGVLFGSLIGLSYYVLGYGRMILVRLLHPAIIAFTAVLSLSTGPLIAMNTQILLVMWDRIFGSIKMRWYILTALAVVGYIIVDVFIARKTPFHTIVTYLSFSQGSAYNRITIWHYGTQNIFDNPFFGVGLNEWARPEWMSSSMDMFWIVGAVQHGIVVWVLWLVLFFSVFLQVAWSKGLNARLQDYRTGYLISLFGFFMAGWTVHFWNALFVYFMFMLGSGLWMTESPSDDGSDMISDDPSRLPGYSRFPPRAVGPAAARESARTLS
ncbi:hypothetical protein ABIE69_002940 [Rhodobacteraceae bacterium MBR-64]|jgi:hypothetical protein